MHLGCTCRAMILHLSSLLGRADVPAHFQHQGCLPSVRHSFCCSSTPFSQSRLAQRQRRARQQQAVITAIAEVAAPKMSFATVQSEAEFTAVLEAGVAAKKIPAQLMPAFLDLYNNYKSECGQHASALRTRHHHAWHHVMSMLAHHPVRAL